MTAPVENVLAVINGYLGVAVPDLASSTPLWLSLLTVGVNGMVGALRGFSGEGQWDLVGVISFALVTGLGGGMIRDMLLGRPAQSLQNPWFLTVVGFSVFVALVMGSRLIRLDLVMASLDALALGLFAVVGAAASLDARLPIVSCILVGTVSAVGGGVTVAVLQGRTPQILMPGEPRALLAVLACCVYLAVATWSEPYASLLGVGSAVVARWISRRWHIRTQSLRAS